MRKSGSDLSDVRKVSEYVSTAPIKLDVSHKEQLLGPINCRCHWIHWKKLVTALQSIDTVTVLGRNMEDIHRPLLLKIPAFVIRMLFGETGDCLLLNGQRVMPNRLI
jgi:NAD dependent epimerase/dehydratase family enzyme